MSAPRPFHPLRMRLDGHDVDPAPAPAADPTPDPEPKNDPAPNDPEPAKDPEPKGDPDPKPDPKLDEPGKKALSQEREAKKAALAAQRKAEQELAEARKKIDEFEDAKRSDLEKAQAAAERAQEAARLANMRAIQSEIRSAAITAEALDPSDIVDLLINNPDRFIKDGGVNDSAIESAVADLLERKPHWKKQAAVAPEPPKAPKPQPDPGQGPRGPQPPIDFLTASAEEVAQARAEMGIRSRR